MAGIEESGRVGARLLGATNGLYDSKRIPYSKTGTGIVCSYISYIKNHQRP